MTELIKKYCIGERAMVTKTEDTFEYLKDLWDESREYFICLHLDSKSKIICREIVHIGGLNTTLIEPRAVFRNAIINNANAIIVAHNHPSGDVEPSINDTKITKKLVKAGKLIGIPVMDHIIFSGTEYRKVI